MSALAGFIVGYVLGAKAGPQSYEKMQAAWKAISESPEVNALLQSLPVVGDMTGGGDGLFTQLRDAVLHAAGAGDRTEGNGAGDGEPARPFASNGVKTVEALVAGGMAIVGDILERGLNMLRERA
jgi:hypothetical protein